MKLGLVSLVMGAILATTQAAISDASSVDANGSADGTISLSQDSRAQREIKLAEVKRKNLSGRIEATAVVEPDAGRIAHVTPRIRARVVKLIAEPGQAVKPGDPLAVLSSIELGQAKNEYLKARSLEEISRQQLAREERLFKDKIAAQKDVLEARANHDTALAQLSSTREALRLLIPPSQLEKIAWSGNGAPLSDFTLTAPIAGTVVKRDLTLGSMVSGDADVITIIDLTKVWVLVNVFEHDLAGLQVGQPADISVNAYPDNRFKGVVSYISAAVDRSTRTVQARIDVPNPQKLLKPGMFASADITTTSNTRATLIAPASAIYDVNGEKSVFVDLGADRFGLRPVKLGQAGGEEVEIVSGVKEGDQVVSEGGLVLKAMLVNTAE
jgi:cobalt-zinc-cadmium efflux system membrane fusion protein